MKDKRPLLANATAHALLISAWTRAQRWLVGRYVVMPDHVHLFCAPADPECRLRTWISFWKHQFTRQWPEAMDKPIWQRDFWDTQLRRGENYFGKWEYVRENPVRAGLVADPDDWPYQGELNVLPW